MKASQWIPIAASLVYSVVTFRRMQAFKQRILDVEPPLRTDAIWSWSASAGFSGSAVLGGSALLMMIETLLVVGKWTPAAGQLLVAAVAVTVVGGLWGAVYWANYLRRWTQRHDSAGSAAPPESER